MEVVVQQDVLSELHESAKILQQTIRRSQALREHCLELYECTQQETMRRSAVLTQPKQPPPLDDVYSTKLTHCRGWLAHKLDLPGR